MAGQSEAAFQAAVLLVTLAGGVAIVLGGLWIAATAIGWLEADMLLDYARTLAALVIVAACCTELLLRGRAGR